MPRPAVFLDPDEPSGSSSQGKPAVFLDPDEPSGPYSQGKPAVFLDRDGVLNRRRLLLVRKRGQLVLLPDIAQAAKRLTDAGFALVIATNQEFVGMRYIEREEHEAIMAEVVRELESAGGKVTGAYACLHPRGSGCHDAKPKPGMLLDAARDLDLDLPRSYMVGDNLKDMLAGKRAGAKTVLVDPRLRTWLQRARSWADHVAPDLPRAAEWILRDAGR